MSKYSIVCKLIGPSDAPLTLSFRFAKDGNCTVMSALRQRISGSVVRLLIITTIPLVPAVTVLGGTVAEGSTTSAAVNTITGQLTCKPSTLNFGNITLEPKTMSVTITSTESSSLIVTKKINAKAVIP